jgi:4a-hydroxytetrahydrobiopterin dehydratase
LSTRTKLSDHDVQSALASLPGWSGDTTEIRREFRFESYSAAVAFTMQVALLAERTDHHPDVTLSWGRVVVVYATHDAGGVTARDLEAARAVSVCYGA